MFNESGMNGHLRIMPDLRENTIGFFALSIMAIGLFS